MTIGLRGVAIVGIISAAMLGVGAFWGVSNRQTVIDALTAQQVAVQRDAQRLDEENQSLAKQIEQLQLDLEKSTQQLDSTYVAVEVGGAVDFPILRGMAREGDTLKSFSTREGVAPDVLKALNPWVTDTVVFKNRQILWMPKPVGSKPKMATP